MKTILGKQLFTKELRRPSMKIIVLSLILLTLYIVLDFVPACHAEDSGTADAPLNPAEQVVKTVCSRGCDYTTPQDAVDAANPGVTIQLKNGVYQTPAIGQPVIRLNRSGTQALPNTIENFPGDRPILDCLGEGNAANVPHDAITNGITLMNTAEWWIIEGLEIRGCHYGIRVFGADHITIRNNKIHHNGEIGISTAFNHDLYVADNEIYHNGTLESDPLAGCHYDKHKYCHGIYLGGKDTNDPDCITRAVTIRRNYIHDHSGYAMHLWSGNSCLQIESDILVENNLMVDNAQGFQFSKGYLGNTMRNNTIVLTNPPPIVESPYKHYYSLLQLGYATQSTPQNKIYNNIFYMDKTSYNATGTPRPAYPLITRTADDNVANILDHNLWFVPDDSKWIWSNTSQNDFSQNYKSLSGWDKNGLHIATDPGFVDISIRDFRLMSNSPAVGAGDDNNCPPEDLEGKERPQYTHCDIGAYELSNNN